MRPLAPLRKLVLQTLAEARGLEQAAQELQVLNHPGLTRLLQINRDYPDPIRWGKQIWPDVNFYDRQVEVIHSVETTPQTVVVAAHEVGKDFVAAFITLRYFLTHLANTVRIVTTSVKDDHLRVLWGEMGRFLEEADFPLDVRRGGLLSVQHRELRRLGADGRPQPISYCVGMVSKSGEGMAGHHADYTLGVIDEASGVDRLVLDRMETWAKRILCFGNPYGGPETFFYDLAEGGDVAVKE